MPDIRINLLEALTDNVQKLAGEHIRTVSEVTGEPIPLSLRTSTALFQIGQEAISNAIGHASPTVITLSCRYERKSVMLTIANDGDGFEYDPLAVGFGIMGMQKRAHDVGGTLEILSAPGVGTRVCVTAKLHNSTLRRKIVGLAWKKLRDLPTMKSI
jgi:signal transduction histidine kinase